MSFKVQRLPPPGEVETKAVWRQLSAAHRQLALLNGRSATIPNEHILINTLALQEAKDSSAIENIITTHDDLYKAQLFDDFFTNAAAKEVSQYAEALKVGFDLVRAQKLITNNTIIRIQALLEGNDAGYRSTPGTTLKNEATGAIVYIPPQTRTEIDALMQNLVEFINDSSMSDADPLVKMALLHHQFETIHPFYDGNGRTGRILNILYLVQQELLELPILYLSRYIIRTKSTYYRELQSVRDTGVWEPWLLYMLKGVEETAIETEQLISRIRQLMQTYKNQIRGELPKIYSQDLLNNLFRHPYTKIEFIMNELHVSRPTATSYLDSLCDHGLLHKVKLGRSNYYINGDLFRLLRDGAAPSDPTDQIITQHEPPALH